MQTYCAVHCGQGLLRREVLQAPCRHRGHAEAPVPSAPSAAGNPSACRVVPLHAREGSGCPTRSSSSADAHVLWFQGGKILDAITSFLHMRTMICCDHRCQGPSSLPWNRYEMSIARHCYNDTCAARHTQPTSAALGTEAQMTAVVYKQALRRPDHFPESLSVCDGRLRIYIGH